MKNLLGAVILGFFLLNANAQVTLNAGDTMTIQFNSLTYRGEAFVPFVPPNGNFDVWIDAATFDSGDLLKLEMYETGPQVSGDGRTNSLANGNPSHCGAGHFWFDRAGSFRVTMLAGSVRITNIDVYVFTGASNNKSFYKDSFVPSAQPRLEILRGSNSVQLSWWTNAATGFVLESSNRLWASPSWITITQSSTVITGRAHITLPASDTAEYFRLRKP